MSGIVNKGFGALNVGLNAGAVVGGVKKELKPATNQYDEILNNKPKKLPVKNGVINAVNSNRMYTAASETIDELVKIAEGRPQEFYPRNRNNNSQYMARKRQVSTLKPLYEEDFDNSKEYNPYLVAGGAMLAGGLIQMALTKNIKSPINSIRTGAMEAAKEYPRTIIKRHPGGKEALKVVKTGTKPLRQQGSYPKFASSKIDEIYKEAMDYSLIDYADLDNLASAAQNVNKNLSKGEKVKKMIKGDIIQTGVESIPMTLAPASIGYALGTNIFNPSYDLAQRKEKPKEIVVDVPKKKVDRLLKGQDIEKKAMREPEPWGQWVTDTLPSKTVQSVSRAIVPASIIALSGRNIKGRLEKIEDYRKDRASQYEPVEPGKTRIIILPGEEMDKEASSVEEEIKKKIKNLTEREREIIRRRKNKTLLTYDDLREGVLKQMRMMG